MKSSPLPLPGQKNYEYAYELAYKLAGEQLAKVDLEQQCRKSGSKYLVVDSQKVIIVEYLNQSYRITLPDIQVSLVDSEVEVPLKDKILILHYLTLAQGVPITNKLIAFPELPEGANYFPTFAKRSIEPITRYFGKQPDLLVAVTGKLGGHRVDYGDTAVAINGFSRVPVTLVLWQGDKEFSPRGNILFDATISDYLATYDIIVLCETIVWKLVGLLREGRVKPSGS